MLDKNTLNSKKWLSPRCILTCICLLVAFNLHAQPSLVFNKRFVECEDKWVAFETDKYGYMQYGFIYIDEKMGLLLHHEGMFKPKRDSTYQIKKLNAAMIKTRLAPNNIKVAIIPESLYNDLQIDSIPAWLKNYKANSNSVSRLYQWGYFYNSWNECKKALDFLLKAKSIDAKHKGLSAELAYSHNCLNEYDKALAILEDAIKDDPTDAYSNKEYIYALVNIKDINKAIEQYHKSIALKVAETYNDENCYNIQRYFYQQKDEKNFNIWKKERRKWRNSNTKNPKYPKTFQKELL